MQDELATERAKAAGQKENEELKAYIDFQIKDAELILKNIQEAITGVEVKNKDKVLNSCMLSFEDRLLCKVDLLSHYIMFSYTEANSDRVVEVADELLLSNDLKLSGADAQAKAKLMIAAVKFMSETTPYVEIKDLLKSALIQAKDYSIKSTIAHNLAVINYCELQDHNDRVSTQGSSIIDSLADEEAIQKEQQQKQSQRNDER